LIFILFHPLKINFNQNVFNCVKCQQDTNCSERQLKDKGNTDMRERETFTRKSCAGLPNISGQKNNEKKKNNL